MRQIDRRLQALEQAANANRTGQTVERYTVDGEEYIQVHWNGVPGKVMHAWQWDAWNEPTEAEEQTQWQA